MRRLLAAGLATLSLAAPAAAGSSSITMAPQSDVVMESYVAFINGYEDVMNSRGARLTQPWAIIRQDRANYYNGRTHDYLDQGDSFFALKANRARMEQMIRNGSISGEAAYRIVRGAAVVRVTIMGRNGMGNSVHVEVLQ